MNLRAWLHKLNESARARRAALNGKPARTERREPTLGGDPNAGDTITSPRPFDLPDTVPGLLRSGERVDPETGEILAAPDVEASRAPRVRRAGDAPPAAVAGDEGNTVAPDAPDEGVSSISRGHAPADALGPDADSDATVPGERSIASVNRARGVRQRMVSLASFAIVAGLVIALLGWYYVNHFSNQKAAAAEAAKLAKQRAAGESTAIKIARVAPPTPPTPPAGATGVSTTIETSVFGSKPPEPTAGTTTPGAGGLFGGMPGQPVGGTPGAGATPGAAPAGPPPKTPEDLARDRKLENGVLVAAEGAAGAMGAAPTLTAAASGELMGAGGAMPMPGAAPGGAGAAGGSGLSNMLRPTITPAVAAQVLPTRRFLLPKGAFIDCTLETAFDSTVDGMVTCISASDLRSADGKVVLLERGSKFTGEKKGDPRQGQARVFVLWNEVTTPTGVRVNLASPNTDELGRAGMGGHVDTHFWARFGGAIMISLVDGIARGLVANQSSAGGNAIILNPQGGRDIIAEVLRGTINIPPTISANQGKRINILVARDVDFRSVYQLRAVNEAGDDATAPGADQ